MRIQPKDLAALAATYQSILTESHDETGSAPVAASTPTQSFEQRLLQAAQNGELTEDLVQQIVAEIWDAAQEAYADMSAQYESELD
jgi:hypothetical protein